MYSKGSLSRVALEIKIYQWLSQRMDRDGGAYMLSPEGTFWLNTKRVVGWSFFHFKPWYWGSAVNPYCKCAVGMCMRRVYYSRHQMFCSMLPPLSVSLLALVNHTAIREKMNHWNNCNDLQSESFTRESTRPWFIQCSMTLWRSLSASILDVVLKARPYCYVSPLSFMTSGAIDDDRNVPVHTHSHCSDSKSIMSRHPPLSCLATLLLIMLVRFWIS